MVSNSGHIGCKNLDQCGAIHRAADVFGTLHLEEAKTSTFAQSFSPQPVDNCNISCSGCCFIMTVVFGMGCKLTIWLRLTKFAVASLVSSCVEQHCVLVSNSVSIPTRDDE